MASRLTAASAPKTAASMPGNSPASALAVSSGTLYAAAYPGSDNFHSNILSADLAAPGAVAVPIPGLSDVPNSVRSLVVAGGNLFWTAHYPNCSSCNDSVYTAPVGGGSPVTLSSSTGASAKGAGYLTTDGTYVYWPLLGGANSKVQRVLAKGSPTAGTIQDVAVGLSPPDILIVADANYVYYLEGFQAYRVKKDGTTLTEPLALVNATPDIYNLFAVDDSFVYGAGSGGQIVGVAKDALAQ